MIQKTALRKLKPEQKRDTQIIKEWFTHPLFPTCNGLLSFLEMRFLFKYFTTFFESVLPKFQPFTCGISAFLYYIFTSFLTRRLCLSRRSWGIALDKHKICSSGSGTCLKFSRKAKPLWTWSRARPQSSAKTQKEESRNVLLRTAEVLLTMKTSQQTFSLVENWMLNFHAWLIRAVMH